MAVAGRRPSVGPFEVKVRCPCSATLLRRAVLARFYLHVLGVVHTPASAVERNVRRFAVYDYFSGGLPHPPCDAVPEDEDEDEEERACAWLAREYDVSLLLPPGLFAAATPYARFTKAKTRRLLAQQTLGDTFFDMLGSMPVELVIAEKARRQASTGASPAVVAGGACEAAEVPIRIALNPPYLVPRPAHALSVMVPVHWRRNQGLSECDIINACIEAKCYRLGSKTEVRCQKCCSSRNSMIKLRAIGERGVLDEQTQCEIYRFRANSICSSSRLHLSCKEVVIGFDIKGAHVMSSPVALRSRTATSKYRAGSDSPLDRSETRLIVRTPSPLTSVVIPPVAISVKLYKNSIFLTARRGAKLVANGCAYLQTRFGDFGFVCARGVILTSQLTDKQREVVFADHPPPVSCVVPADWHEGLWRYNLLICCYRSLPALQLGGSVVAPVVAAAAPADPISATQLLAAFTN
eukprot:TRINITY_DN4791_c0_g1_i1.p1 TRINITY_DN4791_c0_g1~~TRINITY_DN4791_c0_g1_i1.p1  ORF type:complete len:492 (-),score=107.40 TRINITY_DN4791_c0_g1_i1:1040-2434(-)